MQKFVFFFFLLLHHLAIGISLKFHFFLRVVIVLIQVYNWDIWHPSLVCHCGLADFLYILVTFFSVFRVLGMNRELATNLFHFLHRKMV